ncbi:MAG: zinc ribbon domain-containing protein [Deltaproteobacteria bacterium]|jgi:putative FmdB family regulatory protein|nr:zinc ribbon domain-containing protein [Deltaproteobacteria bacterium]
MPIYEFQCGQCGQITEALLKFSDKPLQECPHCGGQLAKLMSMNSFQLKGGGWYVTDYAKKPGASAPAKAAEAKPAAEASGSAPESKAEAKAETKAESKA